MSINPVVQIHGKSQIVTSENIAEVFHKRHDNVVQTIDKKISMLEELERVSRLYFKERDYIDKRGKQQRAFELTRLGFDYLVLGFNGKDADAYKLQYIDMFHHNQNILIQQQINYAMPEWREERFLGKATRRAFTDNIKLLQAHAKAAGSKGYTHFYTNYSSMINKVLFTWDSEYRFNRDDCTVQQIDDIRTAEDYCADIIRKSLLDELDYRVAYQKCKTAMVEVADVIGVSEVPSQPFGLEVSDADT